MCSLPFSINLALGLTGSNILFFLLCLLLRAFANPTVMTPLLVLPHLKEIPLLLIPLKFFGSSSSFLLALLGLPRASLRRERDMVGYSILDQNFILGID